MCLEIWNSIVSYFLCCRVRLSCGWESQGAQDFPKLCAGFPKSFPRIQMLPLPQLSRRASNNKRISFYMQTESEQSSMNAFKTFNRHFFYLSADGTFEFCSFFLSTYTVFCLFCNDGIGTRWWWSWWLATSRRGYISHSAQLFFTHIPILFTGWSKSNFKADLDSSIEYDADLFTSGQ